MKNGRGHKLVLTDEHIVAYRRGVSANALAKILDCHHEAVTNALRRQGEVVRTNDRFSLMNPGTPSQQSRWKLVLRLRAKGMTFKAIGSRLGCSPQCAAKIYRTAQRRALA